ncbi:MAG: histidine--tRNA ligase [Saprospiraceae bacterium]|nr:histidine--tRNA ligase [Saprospiraceae bacterium]
MSKPSLPEGTRDFGPEQVRRRNYIFDTIRAVFVKFGFQPLETPAMENLSTLTGKYGDEGDKLLFKILNNGDYLKDADADALAQRDSNKLLRSIAKRGLRYDLTVPFARYVVMNRHALALPFKRYQIQPVWRADRPQRGRYREFYQCDADVIGSDSLVYEAELAQIYDEAFRLLRLPVVIKINNRKILFGIAEAAGIPEQFMDMTVAIDKLDKIGPDGVRKELAERGIGPDAIATIENILAAPSLEALRPAFAHSETGQKGLEELDRVFRYLSQSPLHNEIRFDITLARGLSYYTGCIFEVAAKDFAMGSIGGGGRYADLTGVFGMPGLPGVGVSFGADRIYDVLEGLNLFPETLDQSVKILFAAFDDATHDYAFACASRLRAAGIAVEVYPEPGKLKKQFEYVAKRNIPYIAITGETEMQNGTVQLKNQATGEQQTLGVEELIGLLG